METEIEVAEHHECWPLKGRGSVPIARISLTRTPTGFSAATSYRMSRGGGSYGHEFPTREAAFDCLLGNVRGYMNWEKHHSDGPAAVDVRDFKTIEAWVATLREPDLFSTATPEPTP